MSSTADFQSNRVFVGNLAYDVKWQELKDFMAQAGEVLRADVLLLANGKSRGCGIVEYASGEAAQASMDQLNNVEFRGRPVYVREDREPLGGGAPVFSLTKGGIPNAVFVENLAYTTSWADLKDHFRTVGNVLRADVHTYQGRSKGRGTVVFEDADGVEAALANLNGSQLDGRALRIRRDLPQEERPLSAPAVATTPPSKCLFITNLPWSTGDAELSALVGSIVPVLSARVQMLGNGKSAGCGIVETVSVEDATNAIGELNGCRFGDRRLTVTYAA